MEFLKLHKLKSSLEACFLYFVKGLCSTFYEAIPVLQIVSNKWEQKHRAPDTYYYVNNDYKAYIEFDTEQAENTKGSGKTKKLVFQKNR